MKNKTSLPDWWPTQKQQQNASKKIIVCGQKIHPLIDSHVVHFPRLEFPLRGCYENKIDSQGILTTVKLRPGGAIFAAPNCWNLPTWHPGLQLISILFGYKQIGISIVSVSSHKSSPLTAKKFSIPRPEIGPLPHILQAMVEQQSRNELSPIFPDLTRSLLACMTDHLQDKQKPTTNRPKSLFENICIYLQAHYNYETTRETVAQEFHISPNHLSRLFQTQGKMTFSKYLVYVRIYRAKHLLQNYTLKLDEIAQRCGYPNTAYFCLVFKHVTKLTPSEYRAKTRQVEQTSE